MATNADKVKEKNIRWETPVSDAKSLGMVSLIQNNHERTLNILLEDGRDPERKRFLISFKNVSAYKNILEEYRLSELENKDKQTLSVGWTRNIQNSIWLGHFTNNEPLLETNNIGSQHYQVCTEDDVIDVISNIEPTVVQVESAKQSDPPPGQSFVYYNSEDRDKIEELLKDMKRQKVDE
jgi:hypothetical protein